MECCKYTAGMLRHKVQLQGLVTTTDPMGGRVETWSSLGDVWAKVEPLSGSQLYVAMRLDSRITHKVIIRYQPGVTAIDRVMFKGRALNIEAVINVEERDQWFELHCVEGSEI